MEDKSSSRISTAADGLFLIAKVVDNEKLSASHLSMVCSLLLLWEQNNFLSTFTVSRKKIMERSAITSIATYHRCLKDLQGYGFVDYNPSYHPGMRSTISWSCNKISASELGE